MNAIKKTISTDTKIKVMVNVLNQGTIYTGFETQLTNWMRGMGKDYEFSLFFPSDRPISNNRNKIVKKFLEGKWDFLVMIDDDNPPLSNIFELLKEDKDVISAVTPGNDDLGIHFHVYKIKEGITFQQYEPKDRSGLQKVDGVSTGCIAIKRKVLEKIKRPFEDIFDDDGVLITNDDMAFCLKCKEAGFEVWAHWDYICHHFKKIDLLQVANLVWLAAKSGIPRISVKEGEV